MYVKMATIRLCKKCYTFGTNEEIFMKFCYNNFKASTFVMWKFQATIFGKILRKKPSKSGMVVYTETSSSVCSTSLKIIDLLVFVFLVLIIFFFLFPLHTRVHFFKYKIIVNFELHENKILYFFNWKLFFLCKSIFLSSLIYTKFCFT